MLAFSIKGMDIKQMCILQESLLETTCTLNKKESEHLLYFNYIIYTNPRNSQCHIYQIKEKFLPIRISRNYACEIHA